STPRSGCAPSATSRDCTSEHWRARSRTSRASATRTSRPTHPSSSFGPTRSPSTRGRAGSFWLCPSAAICEDAMDPFVPRFSDPRDGEAFVAVLEQFERGEISPEKFRAFRLANGVYGQRQEGRQMVRVKIPQGVLSPSQCEALADVADRYVPARLGHVTTRQN